MPHYQGGYIASIDTPFDIDTLYSLTQILRNLLTH